MRRLLPAPRLLPITMAAMIALMGVKSVALVRAAVPSQAEAAQPAPTEPGAKPAAHPETQAASADKADASKPQAGGKGDAAKSRAVADKQNAEAAPKVAGETPDANEPPVSETERGLLLELRERRKLLETRDIELQAREQVLAASEHRLASRLDELTALRGRLEALETARKEHDDANWRSMVKLYESMKPRDAAVIFNDLDMSVLLQVVDRMKETRAAPVLAAMQPERARQLTAELAQMRAKANSASVAPPTKQGG